MRIDMNKIMYKGKKRKNIVMSNLSTSYTQAHEKSEKMFQIKNKEIKILMNYALFM